MLLKSVSVSRSVDDRGAEEETGGVERLPFCRGVPSEARLPVQTAAEEEEGAAAACSIERLPCCRRVPSEARMPAQRKKRL